MLYCNICKSKLQGRQQKYCSLQCKNKDSNHKHQNYKRQQERGTERKRYLVNLKGGCCSVCGYNKSLAALCFHHLNPKTKTMQITIRECSNNSLKTLLEEANKCVLLCHNCHMELHFTT